MSREREDSVSNVWIQHMELQVKYSKTAFFPEVHLRNFNMLTDNITLQERDAVCRVPQTYVNYVNPVLTKCLGSTPESTFGETLDHGIRCNLYRNHASCMVAE